METYKRAVFEGTTISTSKGMLNPNQLTQLSISELDSLAVHLQEQYNSSGSKSFVKDKTKKDKGLKHKFELVLDILRTKQDLMEKEAIRLQNKEHNAKIDLLIAQKEEDSTKELSIEELKALKR